MNTFDVDILADFQSADMQCRLQAVQVFALTETPISTIAYEKLGWLAEHDPVPEVRAGAERAVRTTRPRLTSSLDPAVSTVTPAMIASILGTAETGERQRLVNALQRTEDPTVLAPILAAIEWETDDHVLAKMLSLIARHGRPEHAAVARRYLSHAEPKVVATALDAIGLLVTGEPAADLLAELGSLSATHALPDLRFLARRIAGRLHARQAAPVEASSNPGLQDLALDGGTAAEKLAALHAIEATRDASRAAAIARAMPRETDDRVLAKMVMVLKELGAREHTEALKEVLKHRDPRVCANAVEALVALADEDVLPALLPLLAREDNRLRANLMVALYPRYPEQVMGYVGRMLKSDRVSFRASGLYCAQFLDRGEMYRSVHALLATEEDAALFTSLVDWALKHGPPERVPNDLDELATARPDRAETLRARRAAGVTAGAEAPATPTGDAPVGLSAGPAPEAPVAPVPERRLRPATQPGISGRRTASRVPIAVPVEPAWRRIARHPATLFGIAIAGVALAVGLSAVRPPPPAPPRVEAMLRPPDRQPRRAVVLHAPGRQAVSQMVEVSLFGSPCTMRLSEFKGAPLHPGVDVWLLEPRLERDKEGTVWLTAARVSVGKTPPATTPE